MEEIGGRRLERGSDWVLGGVCSGLAGYFSVDALFVRIVFVLLALASGAGLVLYLVLWLFMPEAGEPSRQGDELGAGIRSVRADLRRIFGSPRSSVVARATGAQPTIRGRRSRAGLVWGGLLIAGGTVLLVQTTGLVPGPAEAWFGSAVLAAIGLTFLAVYVVTPARWWAVIPAGVMLSTAVAAAAGPFVSGTAAGAIVLAGLSATFGAVALLPASGRPRTWAWIPVGVLAVLAVVTLGSIQAAVFWPLVLIVVGTYLVVAWAGRERRSGG